MCQSASQMRRAAGESGEQITEGLKERKEPYCCVLAIRWEGTGRPERLCAIETERTGADCSPVEDYVPPRFPAARPRCPATGLGKRGRLRAPSPRRDVRSVSHLLMMNPDVTYHAKPHAYLVVYVNCTLCASSSQDARNGGSRAFAEESPLVSPLTSRSTRRPASAAANSVSTGSRPSFIVKRCGVSAKPLAPGMNGGSCSSPGHLRGARNARGRKNI